MKRWLVTVILLVTPAHGIVNTEPLRRQIKETGHVGRIGASFGGKGGNVDGLFFKGMSFLGALWDPHLVFLQTDGEFARFGGETVDQSNFGHFRYNFQWLSWMHPEVFGQIEASQFRELELRVLGGAGPRFILVQDVLFLGTAWFYEYERADQINRAHRWSSYLSVYLPMGPLNLSNTLYYQPRFDDFTDFRMLNVISFETKLGKRFNSGVTIILRYDSMPPLDVLRGDWEALNMFNFQF